MYAWIMLDHWSLTQQQCGGQPCVEVEIIKYCLQTIGTDLNAHNTEHGGVYILESCNGAMEIQA